MRFRLSLFLLTLLMISSAADACRVWIPPEKRIKTGFESGTIEAVAIVEVLQSRYIAEKGADSHPWAGKVRVVKRVLNTGTPLQIEFSGGHGSAGCAFLPPAKPKIGEKWVIYFWRSEANGFEPWLEMPLSLAREFDFRIGNR